MPSLDEAQRRHARHYATRLWHLRKEYESASEPERVIERFEAEWPQFQRGQTWAAGEAGGTGRDPEVAYLYSAAAQPLVSLRHPPTTVRSWLESGVRFARERGDPGLEAEKLTALATAYANAGEYREAASVERQALALHRSAAGSHDPVYQATQEAGYLANLGAFEGALGDREAARQAYEAARDVFQRVGERQQEARMWGNLGTLDADEGEDERALEKYERALTLAHEEDDTDAIELWLGATGNSLAKLGRVEEAQESLTAALALARRLGDRSREALRKGNLAEVLRRIGDFDGAIEHRRQALQLAREMGDPRTEALQRFGLAQIYADQGLRQDAVEAFREAEQAFSAVEMEPEATRARANAKQQENAEAVDTVIARVQSLAESEELDEAMTALREALALGELSPARRSLLLGWLGAVEHNALRIDDAANHLVEALQIDGELQQPKLHAWHLLNVGDVYRRLGDGDRARAAYLAGLQLNGLDAEVETNLRTALSLIEEPEALAADTAEAAKDLALELANRHLAGHDARLTVTYLDDATVSGTFAAVELTSELPAITIVLDAGLPLRLAFDRVASVRLNEDGPR